MCFLTGPVARWMAVRADTGNISDQAGPLVMTAGPTTPKACQASFAKVGVSGGWILTSLLECFGIVVYLRSLGWNGICW